MLAFKTINDRDNNSCSNVFRLFSKLNCCQCALPGSPKKVLMGLKLEKLPLVHFIFSSHLKFATADIQRRYVFIERLNANQLLFSSWVRQCESMQKGSTHLTIVSFNVSYWEMVLIVVCNQCNVTPNLGGHYEEVHKEEVVGFSVSCSWSRPWWWHAER